MENFLPQNGKWRREWDLNPRDAHHARPISSRVPSAAQPSLRNRRPSRAPETRHSLPHPGRQFNRFLIRAIKKAREIPRLNGTAGRARNRSASRAAGADPGSLPPGRPHRRLPMRFRPAATASPPWYPSGRTSIRLRRPAPPRFHRPGDQCRSSGSPPRHPETAPDPCRTTA